MASKSRLPGEGAAADLVERVLQLGAAVLYMPLPLVAGLVVLDAGIQGAHITNQSVIYALRPDARSRVTTSTTGTLTQPISGTTTNGSVATSRTS